MALYIKPEYVFRVIGLLNRFRKLRILLIIYKFNFGLGAVLGFVVVVAKFGPRYFANHNF